MAIQKGGIFFSKRILDFIDDITQYTNNWGNMTYGEDKTAYIMRFSPRKNYCTHREKI